MRVSIDTRMFCRKPASADVHSRPLPLLAWTELSRIGAAAFYDIWKLTNRILCTTVLASLSISQLRLWRLSVHGRRMTTASRAERMHAAFETEVFQSMAYQIGGEEQVIGHSVMMNGS